MSKQRKDPPSLIDGLKSFYEGKGHEVDDELIGRMATDYAGEEDKLWKELFAAVNEPLTDDQAMNLKNKFTNPFFEVKKKDGIQPSSTEPLQLSASGDAPAAGQTSLQDQGESQRPSPLKPEDPYETQKSLIADKFSINKDALVMRMNTGAMSQDEVISEAARMQKEKDAQLAMVGISRFTSMSPSAPEDNELQKAMSKVSDRIKIGGGITGAYTALDNKVLEMVTAEKNMSRAEAMQYLDASSSPYGENGKVSREELLRLKREAAAGTDFDVPQSVIDSYIYTGDQERQNRIGGDRSVDFSAPGSNYVRFLPEIVDKAITDGYPGIDDNTRNKVRSQLTSRLLNESAYVEASKRAGETLKANGIEAPETLIPAVQGKINEAAEKYAEEMNVLSGRIESLVEKRQAEYRAEAAVKNDAQRAALTSYADGLSKGVQSGQYTQDQAQELLADYEKSLMQERTSLFNQHSNNIASQSRALKEQYDRISSNHTERIKMIAGEFGLEMEDGQVDIEGYLDKYGALVESHMGDVSYERMKIRQDAAKEMSFEERFGNAIHLGYMDLFSSVGGGMQWLGMNEGGEFLSDMAAMQNQAIPVQDFGEFDWSQMGNPDWWVEKGARMIPLTSMLAGGGAAAFAGGTAAAGAMGVQSQLGTTLIAALAGGGASRMLESTMEAGNKYDEVIRSGGTNEEAGRKASEVFKGNAALFLVDTLQYAITLGGIPKHIGKGKLIGRVTQTSNTMLGKGGINFVTEGLEESYQNYISAKTDNPILTFSEYIQSPEGKESFALGGIAGVGFSVVMAGNEQGRMSHGYDKILEAAKRSTNIEEGSLMAHQKAVEALSLLRDRGVISEQEFNDGVAEASEVLKTLVQSSRGDLPVPIESRNHKEYTILSRQYGRLQEANVEEKDDSVRSYRERQMRKLRDRMDSIVNDPDGVSSYSVGGVPMSQEDFIKLAENEEFSKIIEAEGSQFEVHNDFLAATHVAMMSGEEAEVSAKVDGLVKETDGVSTVEELKERANQNYKRGGPDAKMWNSVVAAIEEYDLAKPTEVAQSSTDNPSFTIDPGKENAVSEYQTRYNEATTEEREMLIDQNPDLHKVSFPDASAEETMANVVNNSKREAKEAKASRVLTADDYARVKEEHPEIYEKIESGEELTGEEAAVVNDYSTGKVEEQERNKKAGLVEVMSQDTDKMEYIGSVDPELKAAIENGSADTQQIDKAISIVKAMPVPDSKPPGFFGLTAKEKARQEEKRKKVRAWADEQRKLGLTPFKQRKGNVQQDFFDTLKEDLESLEALAELAYFAIREGVDNIMTWVATEGLPLVDETKAAWYRGMRQFKMETERPIEFYGELSRRDALVEMVQDDQVAIRRLEQRVKESKEKAGEPAVIPDSESVYQKKELATSRAVYAIQKFNEEILGRPSYERGQKAVNDKSLVKRIKDLGITLDDFSMYIYALHAKEFNEHVRIKKQAEVDAELARLTDRLNNMKTDAGREAVEAKMDMIASNIDLNWVVPDHGSGMTNQEADAILQHYQEQEEYSALDSLYQEYREKVIIGKLDLLLDGGIITEDQHTELVDGVFKNYVPLKVSIDALLNTRDMSPGSTGGGSVIERVKGSYKYNFLQRNNPFAQSIIDYHAAVRMVETNKSAVAMVNLAKANPDPKLWEVMSSKAIVVVDEEGNITQYTDLISPTVKDNSIIAIIDGKVKYVHFKPVVNEDGSVTRHPVIRAMKKSAVEGEAALGWMLSVSRLFVNFKRSLTTQYNVFFSVPNLARDIQDAMINMQSINGDTEFKVPLNKIRAATLKAIPGAMRAIWNGPLNTKSSRKMAERWQMAREDGMPINWTFYEGAEKELQEALSQVNKYDSKKKAFPVRAWNSVLQRIDDFNHTVENGSRLAVYSALLDVGVTRERAAAIAKNITLNFEKRGTATNKINALLLFANAGIQGVARSSQLVRKDGKWNASGIGYLTAITGMSFANAMLMDFLDEDDELDVYGDFDRDNYIMIFNPFDPDSPLRIPKTYSLARFSMNLGQSMYDVSAEKTTPVVAATRVLNSMRAVTDPISGSSENVISSFTPELLKIPVQWYMNRKWSGQPFYYSYGEVEPKDMVTSSTPKWAIDISESVNNATDFFGTGRGMISPAPVLLDYIVKDYMGGVGKELTNVAEMVSAAVKMNADGKDPFDAIDVNKLPISRRFYVDLDQKQEQYLYRFSDLAKRPNYDGITESEIAIARKAFAVMREKSLVSPRMLKRYRKEFAEKYNVFL